jgi:hypothetical protein
MKSLRTALLCGLAVAFLAIGCNFVFTASNTVDASKIGSVTDTITPTTLQPAACANANPVHPTVKTVSAAAIVTGTQSGELIIGNRNDTQTIDGAGGNNCVVAGAVPSDKTVTMTASTAGTTVCVKGPGPGSYIYGAGCDIHA